MKLDDLLQADSTSDLDQDLLDALSIFGFTSATYTLFQRKPNNEFVGVIAGQHKDGSAMNWVGTGKTPDEAYTSAIDSIAKWILNQPIGATP